MHQFKDANGQTWDVHITVQTVRRVRNLVGVNLLDVFTGGLLKELAIDAVKLVDVLYAVLQPQCEAKGITDEQFGEAMAGDAIAAATDAFLQSLVDFSPSPKARASLSEILRLSKQVEAKAHEAIAANLGKLDADALAQSIVSRQPAMSFGGSFSNTQESSG